MKEPRRLLEMQAELNDELSRALDPSAADPSELELQQWTSQLGSALGVTLAPPPPISTVGANGAAKITAAASAVKTLPAWKLGAWVFGGVVLGAGLSGAVTAGVMTPDNPAPAVASAQPVTTPSAQALVEAPAPPLVPQPPLPHAEPVAPTPSAPATQKVPSANSAAVPAEPALPTSDELTILHQAQASLGANPARALTLSAQHEREFPSGALTQEREVIAIDALLRLGRVAEAQARAQRFELKYPGSAHGRHVQQLLKSAHAR